MLPQVQESVLPTNRQIRTNANKANNDPWGRSVNNETYIAKDLFRIKFEAVAAAIFGIIGALFCSVSYPLGGFFLAVGFITFIDMWKKNKAPNELEKALVEVANEPLENLPEVSWREKNKGHLDSFDAEAMTHGIMSLKEKGKVVAVAIKINNQQVKVFCLEGRFEVLSKNSLLGNASSFFSVESQISFPKNAPHTIENIIV